MLSTPPPSTEPHARASVVHGFRAALVDLKGEEALARLAARLPLQTRTATVDALLLPFEWVPIAHVIAWHEALWNGPCGADEQELARFVARSIGLGLGRFKAAFFHAVTADRLVARAHELWRWQHTHGEVTARVEGSTGVVTLRDHPYVDNSASRRVTAESYRQIVTIAGARDVHVAWGGTRELTVHLSWR
jgi:hypothetical protein